jgi:hypothetical protein
MMDQTRPAEHYLSFVIHLVLSFLAPTIICVRSLGWIQCYPVIRFATLTNFLIYDVKRLH